MSLIGSVGTYFVNPNDSNAIGAAAGVVTIPVKPVFGVLIGRGIEAVYDARDAYAARRN
jgi:hypothetical protein